MRVPPDSIWNLGWLDGLVYVFSDYGKRGIRLDLDFQNMIWEIRRIWWCSGKDRKVPCIGTTKGKKGTQEFLGQVGQSGRRISVVFMILEEGFRLDSRLMIATGDKGNCRSDELSQTQGGLRVRKVNGRVFVVFLGFLVLNNNGL